MGSCGIRDAGWGWRREFEFRSGAGRGLVFQSERLGDDDDDLGIFCGLGFTVNNDVLPFVLPQGTADQQLGSIQVGNALAGRVDQFPLIELVTCDPFSCRLENSIKVAKQVGHCRPF